MFALWQIGIYLEPMLGRVRFAALYLISALGGSVGYLLLATPPGGIADLQQGSSWVIGTVGASGAVFGLFAALLVLNRHLGRSSAGIVVVLAINAVLGFVVPGIAWQAHLGGAITGARARGAHRHHRAPVAPAAAAARTARRGAGAGRARDGEVRPQRPDLHAPDPDRLSRPGTPPGRGLTRL